jgi:hypothetical protein
MSDANRKPFDDSFHGPDPEFRGFFGALGAIFQCLAIWGLVRLVAKVANHEVDLKWQGSDIKALEARVERIASRLNGTRAEARP